MVASENTRRRFLGRCTDLLLALIGMLIAVPALGYLGAPLWRRRGAETPGAFVDLGPLDAIPIGAWTLLALEIVHQDGWAKTRQKHAVWVRRGGGEEKDITVLSPICPHLGCPISWMAARSEFLCPCHGGIFNADGQRQAGPPPRGMDVLESQVRNGRLWVRWQDFKIGVAEQVSVQA
jgi:menaquinol-cytochrome c reductase iron-sulfur subunit